MIDEEFLHWISVDSISKKYDVGWRAIYRHAHATGIFEQRFRNLRSGLAHIAECASRIMPASRDVIRAIHHLARINAKGEWIEPTKRVVLSTSNSTRIAVPSESAAADEPRGGSVAMSEQRESRGAPKRPRRAPKSRKQSSRKSR